MPSHLNHTGEQLDTAIQMVLNNYADVSTVDASASDVLAGKKIVNALGAEITGTMPAATVAAQADILGSTLVDGGARLAIQVRSRAILSTPGYVAEGDSAIETLYVRAQGGGDQPQLHKPTVSVSGNVLTITDDPDNGDFVGWYKVYADGMYLGDSEDGSYDLSGITEPTAEITARACADHFVDSAMSDPASWLQLFTVNMYDDDQTTFLQTQSVYYGQMPTYKPSKTGLRFAGWTDAEGRRVSAITSNCTIYAEWDDSRTIRAGTYYIKPYINQYFPETSYYTITFTVTALWNGQPRTWTYTSYKLGSNQYYAYVGATENDEWGTGAKLAIASDGTALPLDFSVSAKTGSNPRKVVVAQDTVMAKEEAATYWYLVFEKDE